MKRILALLLVLSAVLALAACSKTPAVTEDEGTTLVYGSGDYTRINPPWMSTARSTCCSSAV